VCFNQAFSGVCCQRVSYGLDLLGGPPRQVGALREVLPQEAVGVLLRAALPWTSGSCKEQLHPAYTL